VDVSFVGAMDEGSELGGAEESDHASRFHLREPMQMSNEMKSVPRDDRIAAMLLHHEVERFYYDEAALLDSHRYEEWLALFSDDAHYFMPIRRTRVQRELDKEFT